MIRRAEARITTLENTFHDFRKGHNAAVDWQQKVMKQLDELKARCAAQDVEIAELRKTAGYNAADFMQSIADATRSRADELRPNKKAVKNG